MKAKLGETLYCSYTYRENSDEPCDVFLVLTFGSGLLTRRAVMGRVSTPAQGLEKGLLSDTADKPAQGPEEGLLPDAAGIPAQGLEKELVPDTTDVEVCGLVSKKARTEPEEVYVRALTEDELEPLKSSLWFHDRQESGGRQGQEPWITRSAS